MKFYIKKPQPGESRQGKRTSFSVYQSVIHNGRSKSSTIKSAAINAINTRYHAGELSDADAIRHLNQIVKNLYADNGIRKAPATFNNDNQKVLESYWKEEYAHRNLADPDAAYSKLSQAINALGKVSIVSGTQNEIQTAINQFKGDKQRMIVGKINAMLDFLKRKHEVRLRKDRASRPRVKYLSIPEFRLLLTFLEPEPFRILCEVLFLTGMRLSEAFAVTPDQIKPNRKTIYIESQRDEDDIEKEPKWGSQRSVYLVGNAADLIEKWCAVRGQLEMRRNTLRRQLKRACYKVFSGQPQKICTFKELRHSYAISLLNKGVSLSLVAQSLGNSLSVCQRHYTGFELTPESVEAIDSIVRRSNG